MLNNLNFKWVKSMSATFAMICGLSMSFNGGTPAEAGRDAAVETVRFHEAATIQEDEIGPRRAVEGFIRAMASADAAAVWRFAYDEDRQAFGTEDALYRTFAETFPALAQASGVIVESIAREGDTSTVELSLADGQGRIHHASVGLWRDDAGHWRVVSCGVEESASGRIASL